MKKLAVIFIIGLLFSVSACKSKTENKKITKEEKCKKAYTHTAKLMNPKGKIEELAKKINEKRVKDCIAKFSDARINCLLNTKSVNDFSKCAKIK